jgi:hypothetical protein
MSNNKKAELIEIGAVLRAFISADEFENRWPLFTKFLDQEVSQDQINAAVKLILKDYKVDDFIHAKRSELLTMYAHTVALIGPEETNRRIPGVRMIIINTVDDNEMKRLMTQIDLIKLNLK